MSRARDEALHALRKNVQMPMRFDGDTLREAGGGVVFEAWPAEFDPVLHALVDLGNAVERGDER
jgi:hypothetical protein